MNVRNRKVLATLLAMTVLMIALWAVSGWSDEGETTKYTLTITDGWGLLDHLSQVLVHAVVDGETSELPVATNDSPSNPVTFQLLPGTYAITLIADFIGIGRLTWILDPITIVGNTTVTLPAPSDK